MVPIAIHRSNPAAAGQSTTTYVRLHRERGRQAGIHDEERLPAVEKGDARTPGLAEVDVEAAGLRIARRQLAEGERPGQYHRAADEPEA